MKIYYTYALVSQEYLTESVFHQWKQGSIIHYACHLGHYLFGAYLEPDCRARENSAWNAFLESVFSLLLASKSLNFFFLTLLLILNRKDNTIGHVVEGNIKDCGRNLKKVVKF